MKDSSIGDRMIALFALAVLLLGPPLVGLFAVPRLVGGLPPLFAYLFGTWSVLIVLLMLGALGAEKRGETQVGEPGEPGRET